MKYECAILLHNIRSAHNVGSIFRTADGAGASRIYLSGFTASPADPVSRAQKDLAKTALGAQDSVPWERAESPTALIGSLKERGWEIVGVEQDARSIDYRSFTLTRPVLILFGNEVLGIPQELRDLCDTIIEIPMHGMKGSLNVSVAAGVILFELAR